MIRTQEKIYQWSTNVPVYVDSASQVQFAQVGSTETMNIEPQASGEVFVATIPNVLLQEAKDIFIYQGEENAKYEAMAAAIPPPSKPISAQVQEIEQQTLDIANAVTSLYETMLVAGVNV